MKKWCLCFLPLGIVILIWCISILHIEALTSLHEDEFADFSAMEYDFMHPWDSAPECKVMRYTKSTAVVYFVSPTGGEKVKFVLKNDQWVFDTVLAIWSTDGTADNYFVWPYYKHYFATYSTD